MEGEFGIWTLSDHESELGFGDACAVVLCQLEYDLWTAISSSDRTGLVVVRERPGVDGCRHRRQLV